MSEDVPLFELPEVPPVRRVGKRVSPEGKVTWTRYNPKTPVRCDDCIQAYVEDPKAPLARQARWSRKQGRERRLLCHAHAQHWRELDPDGLDDAKGRSR